MKNLKKFNGWSLLLAVLSLCLCLCLLSSCAGESLYIPDVEAQVKTEDLNVKARQALVEVENIIPSEVVDIKKIDNRTWLATMSDGNIIDLLHTGDVQAEEVKEIGVSEEEIDDKTSTVTVEFSSSSSLNPSLIRSTSYVKRMKSSDPEPVDTIPSIVDPTKVREYLVADTVMNYKTTSKKFVANMVHTLRRVTEWSDGKEEYDTIWNKTFQVGKTFFENLSENGEGGLKTQCPAKEFKYAVELQELSAENEVDDAFSIIYRTNQFHFSGRFVCDTGSEQEWVGNVAFETRDITVSFEDYSAEYIFSSSFSCALDSQWEENRGKADEEESGHLYKYDATSCTLWNVSFNGTFVGQDKIEIDVCQY